MLKQWYKYVFPGFLSNCENSNLLSCMIHILGLGVESKLTSPCYGLLLQFGNRPGSSCELPDVFFLASRSQILLHQHNYENIDQVFRQVIIR